MSDSFNSRVVIVGAGQAGAMAAMALRELGHVGSITLIGDEAEAPYERPPLSKDALLHPDDTRILIREPSHYASIHVQLRLDTSVTNVVADERKVVLSDGSSLDYDFLILATGARARRLPQLDALGARVHTLRSIADAQRLQSQLVRGAKAILVGAGVIGLELASSLIDLGLSVDLVDQAPRIMSRNAPELVSDVLKQAHESWGVRFHLGVSVDAAQDNGNGIVLNLTDGTVLEGDLLVYGVGAVVNDALARSAGIELLNGAVVVNALCQTSRPEILAAGDVAITVGTSGTPIRLETWENANTQAMIAARTILNLEPAPATVPWFWTDQCGMNLQFSGDMQAPDWVVRGSVKEASFMAWGLLKGVVVGAITVNQGREMRPAKELIAKKAAIPASVLGDLKVNLRHLAKAPEQFAGKVG
ncbi:FAD-dependent oxidoreductase [Diaphorobacter sp. HDW4B]|uniref:3-phenylpropionate/cinnamic acid dioxygenase ferredoxin--NAD(+) reductase subunit n=1 Tax=Diaphorobacter sp. HDW4B TaxID=2714925 RepID=UPI001408875A|nr:3-phenylpropionate/cinnamic acid dioxygenase ferredoxin--NAD(+) reductase subunit [Diaphorobacter sp. HDW4B]QIL69704.1 FAD-dependent oxidoreductase [Diaphorobacter sp. HDW4B]